MLKSCLALPLLSLALTFSQASHSFSLLGSESEEVIAGEIAITQVSEDFYLFQRNSNQSCKDLGLMSTENFEDFVDDMSSQTTWAQVKSALVYTPIIAGGTLLGLAGGAALSPFTGGGSILVGGAVGVGGGVYAVQVLDSAWDLKVKERKKIKKALQSEEVTLVLTGDQEFLDFTEELLQDYLEHTPPEINLQINLL